MVVGRLASLDLRAMPEDAEFLCPNRLDEVVAEEAEKPGSKAVRLWYSALTGARLCLASWSPSMRQEEPHRQRESIEGKVVSSVPRWVP